VPVAVHDAALVLDHVNVALAPAVMVEGLTAIVTVGTGGALTVTVVVACPVPLAPVQDSAYLVVAFGETARVPLIGSAPVQPPDALQAFAPVLDQVSVELAPDVMVVGFAAKVTVVVLVDGASVMVAVGAVAAVALGTPWEAAIWIASNAAAAYQDVLVKALPPLLQYLYFSANL
jgi:hypothetical protein